MGVGQSWNAARARGEGGQLTDDGSNAAVEEIQGLAQDEDIGVVGDKSAGGPEMQDTAGLSGLLGKMPQMGDDVVAGLALDLCHPL